MLTIDKAMKRVRKGYKLLDKKCPGWQHNINQATLALESTSTCILGQQFDFYIDGLTLLRLNTEEDAIKHGFDVGHQAKPADWSLLTETWIFMINHDSRWYKTAPD